MSVEVKLELGHRAVMKEKPTQEGFTHDWTVFVRGAEGNNIQFFVEKVVFHLHESFPKPKRVLKEPPYSVSEAGYAGFIMPIDVYFRTREEPKKVTFKYDLYLRLESPPVSNIRIEKLTFQNPSDDFRNKLIKAGGLAGALTGSAAGGSTSLSTQACAPPPHTDDQPIIIPKPVVVEKKPRPHVPCKEIKTSQPPASKPSQPFTDIFGAPIRTKNSPDSSSTKSKDSGYSSLTKAKHTSSTVVSSVKEGKSTSKESHKSKDSQHSSKESRHTAKETHSSSKDSHQTKDTHPSSKETSQEKDLHVPSKDFHHKEGHHTPKEAHYSKEIHHKTKEHHPNPKEGHKKDSHHSSKETKSSKDSRSSDSKSSKSVKSDKDSSKSGLKKTAPTDSHSSHGNAEKKKKLSPVSSESSDKSSSHSKHKVKDIKDKAEKQKNKPSSNSVKKEEEKPKYKSSPAPPEPAEPKEMAKPKPSSPKTPSHPPPTVKPPSPPPKSPSPASLDSGSDDESSKSVFNAHYSSSPSSISESSLHSTLLRLSDHSIISPLSDNDSKKSEDFSPPSKRKVSSDYDLDEESPEPKPLESRLPKFNNKKQHVQHKSSKHKPESFHRGNGSIHSDISMQHSPSPDLQNISGCNNSAYEKELYEMQRILMSTSDRNFLQSVVDVIETTGKYEITDTTFDFDLLSLDHAIIQQIKTLFDKL